MVDIKKVADAADMIINGYAFTKDGKYVRVLNLNRPTKAAVFLNDEIIETTMDGIEMAITKDYYKEMYLTWSSISDTGYYEGN